MLKNPALYMPAMVGGIMGIFVATLPHAWTFGHKMMVALPVAALVGMCGGALAMYLQKK